MLAVEDASSSSPPTVYFGNGCFWGRQKDFVDVEKRLGRKESDISATVGYAGGADVGRHCLNYICTLQDQICASLPASFNCMRSRSILAAWILAACLFPCCPGGIEVINDNFEVQLQHQVLLLTSISVRLFFTVKCIAKSYDVTMKVLCRS